ncbi:pectin lyase fold/virulence factor [Emericellopsis atlantica]|uniref:pectate lyase n=1 Tax=Emericellopsis atlantica TaxID=2614577 RepID=A0A9P8CQC6_9HYPO|nr:pectin lyase fold/virulence factor [Emericellopsis atlantica]KAG9254970.1 pectin lyase fold/virulence factor [Emericellopsis atlantica]
MKFVSSILSLALVALALASPLEKRASATDPCNIGYCTQNGGTTGGAGGSTTTVRSVSELQAAASASGPRIIFVEGSIKGAAKIDVGSDKTIIGRPGSGLEGVGLEVYGQSNVIIRNMKIGKVLADYGDAIRILYSTNVWVDHCDLYGDRSVSKDTYDGLVDLSHAADWVTISYTYFHDHSKASLVGHSDSNGAEDKGKLRVTYANNHFYNLASRTPLLRFGTAHIFNNLYDAVDTGVNTRMGAQALVQSSVFQNSGKKAIFSESSKEVGYAVAIDVVLGGQSANTAPQGSLGAGSFPYQYSLLGSGRVASTVPGQAGQRLTF